MLFSTLRIYNMGHCSRLFRAVPGLFVSPSILSPTFPRASFFAVICCAYVFSLSTLVLTIYKLT